MSEIKWRQTGAQVARGARPDARDGDRLYLFKNVGALRATYQIKVLTYLAVTRGGKLIIRVPKRCEITPSLRRHIDENREVVRLEKV